MYCKNCGTTLAEGSETCANCEATLILAKSPLLHAEAVLQTPEAASAAHFHSLHEQIWQTLADYQVKQQGELAQLRVELETKLKFVETPRPKPDAKVHFKLPASKSSLVILFFATAGLVGFIWFIYKLVNSNRAIRFDNIAILATMLTVIGSLYLAYDLLGRQHGPLRWVSLFVTSGLIGAVFLEPEALVAVATGYIINALQILLVGIVLGSFSGVLFAIPEDPRHPHIFSGKACMAGGLLGIFFWFALFGIFAPIHSITDVELYLLVATLFGVPSGILLGGFHHFFRGNYRPGRPPIFSWRSSLKAFCILLAFWGVIVLIAPLGSALLTDTLVVAFVSLAAAIPSGFASYIFWWLNHLPDRVLGAVGFVLTLIGAVLPVVQPIFDILSVGKH